MEKSAAEAEAVGLSESGGWPAASGGLSAAASFLPHVSAHGIDPPSAHLPRGPQVVEELAKLGVAADAIEGILQVGASAVPGFWSL